MRYDPRPATGLLLAVALLLAGSATAWAGSPAPSAPVPAPAQAAPHPEDWQSVIDGQIAAFRRGDGAAALKLAGEAFRANFADPDTFLVSILASGYGPIFTSVSDSFGSFSQPDAQTVMQIVHLVGPKDEHYEAVYALAKETDGWRVQGVTLRKEAGINV